MPQSARLSERGGGGNRYLGNAQIDPTFFKLGLPLPTHGPSEKGGATADQIRLQNFNLDLFSFHTSRQLSLDKLV